MKLITLGEYEIHESERHGKAVKGTKKTNSIQVHKPIGRGLGYLMLKSFSFPVDDVYKRVGAIHKATAFVKERTERPGCPICHDLNCKSDHK